LLAGVVVVGIILRLGALARTAQLKESAVKWAAAYYQRLVRLDASGKARTGEFELYAAFDRRSYRDGIGRVRSFVVIRTFGTDASSMRVQLLVQHEHSQRSEICFLAPSPAGWKALEFGEGG